VQVLPGVGGNQQPEHAKARPSRRQIFEPDSSSGLHRDSPEVHFGRLADGDIARTPHLCLTCERCAAQHGAALVGLGNPKSGARVHSTKAATPHSHPRSPPRLPVGLVQTRQTLISSLTPLSNVFTSNPTDLPGGVKSWEVNVRVARRNPMPHKRLRARGISQGKLRWPCGNSRRWRYSGVEPEVTSEWL
jgi:hypothetical protein